jgi:hypothetical protein
MPPHALDLVIGDMTHGRYHFDLKGRPLLIYTPFLHKNTTLELTGEELRASFSEIAAFMGQIMLPNYQVLMNFDTWLNHAHVHWKIRADEQSIWAIRLRHLERVASSRLWPCSLLEGNSKRVSDGSKNGRQRVTREVRYPSQGQAGGGRARKEAVEESI